MAKYKNISGGWLRFELKGNDKIIEPGHTFQSEESNDFLEGAVALGTLELVGEEPKAAAPASNSASPQNSGN